MTKLVCALVVASEVLLLASLVLSIASPEKRVWPPPGRRSWRFWFTWGFTLLALGGAVLLGLIDYSSVYRIIAASDAGRLVPR